MNKLKFGTIVDQCDEQVNKCPKCNYRTLCQQITENHTGKPYQYKDNEFTKNKTVDEMLARKAV